MARKESKMRNVAKFYDEILDLMRLYEFSMDDLEQVFRIREDKIPVLEKKIEELRSLKPEIVGFDGHGVWPYHLAGYDPYSKKVIAQSRIPDECALIDIDQFVFGKCSFNLDSLMETEQAPK